MNRVTRDQIIDRFPLADELSRRHITVVGKGKEKAGKCPFHDDRNASFSVNLEKGVWHCHAGCGGGSIIDFIAKADGKPPEDVFKALAAQTDATTIKTPSASSQIVLKAVYSYLDRLGNEVYQVCRFEPKTFRQRRMVSGAWVWNMEGVERVLYRLPQIQASPVVWIVEGEKDADNLVRLGFCATCNVGGAGKWMDSYTEALTGKEIAICGDNDKPGQEHVQKVFDSLAGKAKTVRVVKIPPPHKDASDYIQAMGDEAGRAGLSALFLAAQVFTKGVNLPVFTIADLEDHYINHVRATESSAFSLGNWLPSFHHAIRPLLPGELVTILAETGVGKTAILQNIALSARGIPLLFFEMELPPELVFERFISIYTQYTQADVEKAYRAGDNMKSDLQKNGHLKHIHICTEARLTTEKLEALINKSELKIGERPKIVLLDYIGLVQGTGKSRYEKMSTIAEDLRIAAKATQTLIICASQVARRDSDDPEITLFDAKDSGSIENSSSLVLGAWRDAKKSETLHVRVLKNTKGKPGKTIACNFNGENLFISEQSPISDDDIPRTL